MCNVRCQDLDVPAKLVGRYVALMESSTPSQAAHVLHGMAAIRFKIKQEQAIPICGLALSRGQQASPGHGMGNDKSSFKSSELGCSEDVVNYVAFFNMMIVRSGI